MKDHNIMRKRLIITLLITVFWLSNINSQADFRSGYIITLNFDTIYGLIDYRGFINNSKVCIFKENEDSIITKYYPDNIFGYRFVDGKFYISKIIHEKDNLKAVFLEYLIHGKVDVYYYKYLNGDKYFIQKQNDTLIELID